MYAEVLFGQQFTGAIKTKDDITHNNHLWNLISRQIVNKVGCVLGTPPPLGRG